ncbi:MAG: RnfH family protein [Pseudomonadota bacterium]
MVPAETISVEVAYATPARQVLLVVEVQADATLEQAIQASGVLQQFPEIDLASNKVGVFGKLGKLADGLHAGDRVEIYRPLIADPKEVRKQRAAQGKVTKKGAGQKNE